ncbi:MULTISPECIES: hypothetical protein [Bifidobacterium]|jgi:hypothetical protein|uniref:hypothetical protein n=1 Tax=Bifidobacterium TaxID=1678 RepID=UPI0023526C28|nr:hypothetical protein [Bifidobacterium tibiigranuli]MCI1211855.1 ribbon-helix-helix domain-containing protein [Bifidobacterium tibiigranuli]MCI1222150.1 ribbon-helix-helix domain-containing protein [Bifidobacterium tibiigranuli]MCI1797714.1 ribbon-helix-helix domain-containing protein [Bifidobacterium tibiigranuli]
MANNNDNVWHWDDSQAKEYTGREAQQQLATMFTQATNTATLDEAEQVLLGRPRAGQPHEETVRLQVRVPESWQKSLDSQAKTKHLSRSEYLRQLLGKAAMQTA